MARSLLRFEENNMSKAEILVIEPFLADLLKLADNHMSLQQQKLSYSTSQEQQNRVTELVGFFEALRLNAQMELERFSNIAQQILS